MRILAVIERDIRRFWRNPIVILFTITMPLVYLLIVGNSIQGEFKNLPLALVDQDGGTYSRRIREGLQALESGPKTLTVLSFSDQGEAIRRVRRGDCKAALIIPPNFTKKVLRGDDPQLGFFSDNTDFLSGNALYEAILGVVNEIKRERIPIRDERNIVKLRHVELYRKLDYDASLAPGVIIMAIFLGTMTTGVFNLVMDKFLGIHESYLVTPLTNKDIVIGSIVSGIILTLISTTIVFIASIIISGISLSGGISTFFSIFFVICLTALALLSMMFVFLGRVDHPRVVGVLGGFLNVIFFFPSGAIYPIETFPSWLRAFATVNPETYAIHALKSLMFKGISLRAIEGDLIFLSLFTAVMLLLSLFIFKRRL